MANDLLRLNKDVTTTKLSLSLFTATLDDNRALGARVAHLETELAGAALRGGRQIEALHAFVAAAAAHRILGDLNAARACLALAAALGGCDDETAQLLKLALADLNAKMVAERAKTLKPKSAPKPKAEEKDTSFAETVAEKKLDAECRAIIAATEETAEEKKAPEPKKAAKKRVTTKKRAPKVDPLS